MKENKEPINQELSEILAKYYDGSFARLVREYIRTSDMTEEEREELVEAVNQIKNNETPTTLMQAPTTSLNVTFWPKKK